MFTFAKQILIIKNIKIMDNEIKKPENPQAYPTLFYNEVTGQINGHDDGMKLRDYFANSAMQGELSGQYNGRNWANEKDLAQRSYLIADAMLKQREL